MEIAEDVVMGVFEEGKGADERTWIGTLAELSTLRAAQALSAATRALDSLHTHGINMQWKATQVTQAWKTRLVRVDAHTGAHHMCTEAEAKAEGKCTEAEELIWRAFSPVPEEEGARLKKKWATTTKKIEPEELDQYLQGKSAGSGPGPSLLRYGHIKHGSKVLKRAVCVYLTAILTGRLGAEIGPEEEQVRTAEDRSSQRVRGWTDAGLQSIISYIRKKPGMGLAKFRPVTLQQVLTKMLTGVMAARMDAVLTAGAVLDPAQAGFTGGGETSQPLHVAVAAIEHAKQARQGLPGAEGTGEIHMLLVDWSNAYCSVSGWVLELAMRRLHMPDELIDLFVGMVEGQRVAVKTAAGMTRDFKVPAGLVTGEVRSIAE